MGNLYATSKSHELPVDRHFLNVYIRDQLMQGICAFFAESNARQLLEEIDKEEAEKERVKEQERQKDREKALKERAKEHAKEKGKAKTKDRENQTQPSKAAQETKAGTTLNSTDLCSISNLHESKAQLLTSDNSQVDTSDNTLATSIDSSAESETIQKRKKKKKAKKEKEKERERSN